MIDTSQISEDMEVIGNDGERVGAVDKVEGNNIKLNRQDPDSGGQHHFISLDLVDSVDGNEVKLNKGGSEVMSEWKAA